MTTYVDCLLDASRQTYIHVLYIDSGVLCTLYVQYCDVCRVSNL